MYVLTKKFGHKREEVAGGWRRLQNEELRNLYASPNIIKVTKSRSMILTRHVERMGEMKHEYNILVEKPEGMRPLRRLGIAGRIILDCILGKGWIGCIWLRIGSSGRLL
jgi:hypothetical protein